jgi:hypothetical protein
MESVRKTGCARSKDTAKKQPDDHHAKTYHEDLPNTILLATAAELAVASSR